MKAPTGLEIQGWIRIYRPSNDQPWNGKGMNRIYGKLSRKDNKHVRIESKITMASGPSVKFTPWTTRRGREQLNISGLSFPANTGCVEPAMENRALSEQNRCI
jgi:hypothetical protein